MINFSIKVSELLKDLRTDEDFDFRCKLEKVNGEAHAMISYLSDTTLLQHRFPEGELFQLVDSFVDQSYISTNGCKIIGIFARKSDYRYFKFWIADSGYIGNSLTMCNELEEVFRKTQKITKIFWE